MDSSSIWFYGSLIFIAFLSFGPYIFNKIDDYNRAKKVKKFHVKCSICNDVEEKCDCYDPSEQW